jgi:hypothetical protein
MKKLLEALDALKRGEDNPALSLGDHLELVYNACAAANQVRQRAMSHAFQALSYRPENTRQLPGFESYSVDGQK